MHDCPLMMRGRPPAAALNSLVASAVEMVQSTQWRGAFAEIGGRGTSGTGGSHHRRWSGGFVCGKAGEMILPPIVQAPAQVRLGPAIGAAERRA